MRDIGMNNRKGIFIFQAFVAFVFIILVTLLIINVEINGVNLTSPFTANNSYESSSTARVTIIKTVLPTENIVASGGSTTILSVVAHQNATIYAMINGIKINFTLDNSSSQSIESLTDSADYVTYTAVYTLPSSTDKVIDLGNICFFGSYSGQTESMKGADISVNAASPIITSDSGVEILTDLSDTFSNDTIDNKSLPTMYPLPKGTIDKIIGETIYESKDDNNKSHLIKYFKLSCGLRVYESTDGIPSSETKVISLKNINLSNSITNGKINVVGRNTVLSLHMSQKSPLLINFLTDSDSSQIPMNSTTDYSLFNASQLEITFCSTSSANDITGIEKSSLFSKAEWEKVNDTTYKLLLTLKKSGAFYGLNYSYDKNDNLIFNFRNPLVISKSNNSFGYSLSGVRIAIDVGHGGDDPGTLGKLPNNNEKDINLDLAKLIDKDLKNLGATVYMTRNSDVNPSFDDRVNAMENFNPDFSFAIHCNSNPDTSIYGVEDFYFYPFSQILAHSIQNSISDVYNKQIYIGSLSSRSKNSISRNRYYPYFDTRFDEFPSILVEYGFISNTTEYNQLIKSSVQKILAQATVSGIINYLK